MCCSDRLNSPHIADMASSPHVRCWPKAGLCHAVNHGWLVVARVAVGAQTDFVAGVGAGFRAVRVFGGDPARGLIRIRVDPPLG